MYQIEITTTPATWQAYAVCERLQQLLDPANTALVDSHGIPVKGQDIATVFTLLWQGGDHNVAQGVPDAAIMRAIWDDGDYRAVTIKRYSFKKTLSKETHSAPEDYIVGCTPDATE